jgi:hypothetical protein
MTIKTAFFVSLATLCLGMFLGLFPTSTLAQAPTQNGPNAATREAFAEALSKTFSQAAKVPVQFSVEGKDNSTLMQHNESATAMGVSKMFANTPEFPTALYNQGFQLFLVTNDKQWWVAKPIADGWSTPNGPFGNREEAMRWWAAGRLINPATGEPVLPKQRQEVAQDLGGAKTAPPMQSVKELNFECETTLAWFNAPENVSAKYSSSDMQSVGSCMGFFEGFIGALKMGQDTVGFISSKGDLPIRVDEHITQIDAISAFVQYVHHNPAAKGQVNTDGVMMALIKAGLITVTK